MLPVLLLRVVLVRGTVELESVVSGATVTIAISPVRLALVLLVVVLLCGTVELVTVVLGVAVELTISSGRLP